MGLGRGIGGMALASIGAATFGLSTASPASAETVRASRQDDVSFRSEGQDTTCRVFNSFEWDTGARFLHVSTWVSRVSGDEGACLNSYPDVRVTYRTPEGDVVTQKLSGGGGTLTADFEGVAGDVRTSNQVYFWEPDTYSDRYFLPK